MTHLHHLDAKLERTNNLMATFRETNIRFTAKVIDTIQKKFQFVIHHNENVIK